MRHLHKYVESSAQLPDDVRASNQHAGFHVTLLSPLREVGTSGVSHAARHLTRVVIDANLGLMLLKGRFAFLLVASVLASSSVTALAQSVEQQERIAASFVLALGRTPTFVEIEQWAKQGPLSLADLLARHRRQLEGDAADQRAVIVKAGQDAFGLAPGEEDIKSLSGGATYTDLLQRQLRWLAEHPPEYEQVVRRAYRAVLQRDAYSLEIDYWKGQPVLSFALLVGCIEDWARRNRPGLTATTGVAAVSVNSPYLATVRLSPAVAAEARVAAGLVPAGDPALASAAGRTLVAPGADRVASVGGIHFTAAGAANLASVLAKQ